MSDSSLFCVCVCGCLCMRLFVCVCVCVYGWVCVGLCVCGRLVACVCLVQRLGNPQLSVFICVKQYIIILEYIATV